MTCLCKDKNGIDRMIEYLGGPSTAERRAELDLHAQECVECRGLLRAWNALDEYQAPAVAPDFDAKLYARIAEERRAPWVVAAWRRVCPAGPMAWWKPAIPVAACAAVAVALFFGTPDGAIVNIDKQAKVEPVSIEQVEQALKDLEMLAPAEL